GVYKVGSTYTALGQKYTPEEDYRYSETGIASWYGADFHNKRTANGEIYNMNAVTAAHRTLPLPSIVRVTNLENGKSIIARVNDRGPYVKNRIIDLSQKGAELLGYKMQGTAKVKVEILAKESQALKEAMLSKNNSSKTYNEAIKYSTVTDTKVAAAATKAPVTATATATQAPIAPAAAPAPANDFGTYYVQVGAYADLDKAKETAESMSRFGNVSIYEAYLSKDGIYRVRLGAYKSRDEALQILDRVLDYGHADVTIVEG
ncbi:MAG: septal ring lytic transglycosylase RlpA family protein, partial [Alphaproteobacteria bacterium]|nr:septal ring lytic transglycosylase RlpA family protein [Alphaproteobacteria bacterium]